MPLTTKQKEANEKFFLKIIDITTEGGQYGYPAINEFFIIVGGVMYGTKRGVKAIKEITPKSFHSKLKIQQEE